MEQISPSLYEITLFIHGWFREELPGDGRAGQRAQPLSWDCWLLGCQGPSSIRESWWQCPCKAWDFGTQFLSISGTDWSQSRITYVTFILLTSMCLPVSETTNTGVILSWDFASEPPLCRGVKASCEPLITQTCKLETLQRVTKDAQCGQSFKK